MIGGGRLPLKSAIAAQTIMTLIIVWTVDTIELGSIFLLIDRIRFRFTT